MFDASPSESALYRNVYITREGHAKNQDRRREMIDTTASESALYAEAYSTRLAHSKKQEEKDMTDEIEFEYQHTLEDGREVGLMMLGGHIYGNADITAGYAEGAEPDIMYLRLVRGEDETLLLLRPDELAAVVQAGSCALTAYLVDMADDDLEYDDDEDV